MITPPTSLLGRRRFLTALAGVTGGAVLVAACGGDSSGSATTADTTGATTAGESTTTAATAGESTSTTSATATATPGETGGPFPADGTNDNGEGEVANVLADPRSVRRDIRSDLDGANTQEGVPFELSVAVVDSGGAPLPGAAVYIWHCNRDGEYSQYNSSMLGGDFSDFSWLRGVQVADANGEVQFLTILPGRYPGRAFHIHFAVYADDTYSNLLLTSQMAVDDNVIDALYAQADGYAASLSNDTDNARDNIFSDGVDHQLLTVTGDAGAGLAATFTAVVA
ncbi:MAG TPA: intradiol ring-cleavage dioxygenase [Acidimicrobiaceae bacterium]|nr:intradiol ring-cleavage dioxygenase [Acidimicrobiaceae bacterium]